MDETLENSTESITPEPEPEPPVKVRKPLSADALEKLKVARERAAESNRAKKIERQKAREARQEEIRRTHDPIVVVEQSESDPEDLEGPPGVIFVRRRRAKPVKTNEELAADLAYQRMFG